MIVGRTALNGQNLTKEQRNQLNTVVSMFGKAGDEHDGVTISFGQTTSPRRAAEHSYQAENGVLKIDITFNSRCSDVLAPPRFGGDLVHERSHGIDGIARGNMDPQTKKEEFQTERKAYNVESLVEGTECTFLRRDGESSVESQLASGFG